MKKLLGILVVLMFVCACPDGKQSDEAKPGPEKKEAAVEDGSKKDEKMEEKAAKKEEKAVDEATPEK